MLFGAISILDAVILIVIAAYAIVGMVRGLAKQVFSLFGFVVVLLLSVLLCSVVAQLLTPVFGGSIERGFRSWMTAKDAGIANDADKFFTVAKDWTNDANVAAALTKLGMPSLLSGLFSGLVKSTFHGFGGSAVLADVLPEQLTGWTMTAIAFTSLMLLLSIALVVTKFLVFKTIKDNKQLSAVDQVLGMTLGIVQGYVIVSVALTVLLTLMSNLPFLSGIQSFLVEQARLSASGKFPIFSFLSSYNWIGEWVVSRFI